MDKKIFSTRLKARREQCGYSSIQSFAIAFDRKFRNGDTGLDGNSPYKGSYGSFKNYENPSKDTFPNLSTAAEMCQLLNCDIDYLLGNIDQPKHIYQAIHERCGLTETSMEQLINWYSHGGCYTKTLNYILSSPNFDNLLYHIGEMMEAKPIYEETVQRLGEWAKSAYAQSTHPDGNAEEKSIHQLLVEAEGQLLNNTCHIAEVKYDVERLKVNDHWAFLVSELEKKATAQPDSENE